MLGNFWDVLKNFRSFRPKFRSDFFAGNEILPDLASVVDSFHHSLVSMASGIRNGFVAAFHSVGDGSRAHIRQCEAFELGPLLASLILTVLHQVIQDRREAATAIDLASGVGEDIYFLCAQ